MGDKCLIDVLDGFVAIWVVVVVEDIFTFWQFYADPSTFMLSFHYICITTLDRIFD